MCLKGICFLKRTDRDIDQCLVITGTINQGIIPVFGVAIAYLETIWLPTANSRSFCFLIIRLTGFSANLVE